MNMLVVLIWIMSRFPSLQNQILLIAKLLLLINIFFLNQSVSAKFDFFNVETAAAPYTVKGLPDKVLTL